MGMGEIGSKKPKSEPNIVPFTDILLVLLVIFMVVTPILTKNENVRLPEAANVMDQPKPEEVLQIVLKSDGTVYLQGKLVEDVTKIATIIEDILEEKKIKERKVLLKVDKDCEYGKVVDLMDGIKNAQIEDIGLVVEKVASSS